MIKIAPVCAALLSLSFATAAMAQTKPAAGDAGTNKQMTFEGLSAMSETDQMAAIKMMSDEDKMTMKKGCPGDAGTNVAMNQTMTEFCKKM